MPDLFFNADEMSRNMPALLGEPPGAFLPHYADGEMLNYAERERANRAIPWSMQLVYYGRMLGRTVVGDGDPPCPVIRMGADYHGPMPGGAIVSRRSTEGWTFEMRVPWSELPEARPFIGAVMGMQVFVSDGDGGGQLNELMWSARWAWGRESGLAWELWRMGKLVLTGLPLEPR